MTCTACGARVPKGSGACAICGWRSAGDPDWDRSVEAAAYDSLREGLSDEQPILGFTRGRLTGSLKLGATFGPRAALAVAVNVGLIPDQVLIQLVDRAGRPLGEKPASIPASDIHCISAADADPLEADRSTRLSIQLISNKGTLRIRTAGRLADGAREIATLWKDLFCSAASYEHACASCGKLLDKPHRFCPFCGAGLSEDLSPRGSNSDGTSEVDAH